MNKINENIEIIKQTSKGLYFLPLGGVGEIGGNCYLYCCDDSWIMIDLGISFADHQFPGIDILIPNIEFINSINDKLKAIIISHAHEDHAGALSYYADMIKCPIYASEFAYNLIRKKIKKNNINNSLNFKIINFEKDINFTNFKLSFIETTHSIPEPSAIIITTKYGKILHTADWKIDKNPIIGKKFSSYNFEKLGDEGLLALIGDSTNANSKGMSGSENDVKIHLTKLFSRFNKRIVITCFSSNITRLESIVKAAKANNRKVAIIGKSIDRTIDAARETGYLKNLDEFISPEEAQYLTRENIVIICTGSQGEKRSALYRIAYNTHQNIYLERGDVVIFSSRDIPGNEKSINNIKNSLTKKNIDIISSEDELVHVSGHAYAEELKKMFQWTRPYLSVPVHGEAIHLLEHAKIAESCQVPITKIIENGNLLKIYPEEPNILSKVETGKMIVEGNKIFKSNSDFVKERVKYSYEGMILVTLLINKDFSLNKKIVISQVGLPFNNTDDLLDYFKINFVEQYIKLNNREKSNHSILMEISKKIIRKHCKNEFSRKPHVQTHIINI